MRWAIAADIGGTWTKLGIVSEGGDLKASKRIPTQGPAGPFLERLRDEIRALLRIEPGSSVGIAVAGFINAAHEAMIYNPNLPWLQNIPLTPELTAAIGRSVILEVDSNASALAEYRCGTGKGSQRFLCVTAGTGIGGGLISGGRILRIAYECIGDVGHVIVEPDGQWCACGGRGCAEASASAPAILKRAGNGGTLEDLAAQARLGDPAAIRAFDEAGRLLGVLLASLSAIFFPDRIALGGGVCEASPLVVRSANAEFRRSAGSLARGDITVSKAALGSWAPLIGAGLAAIENGSR